MKCRRQYTGWMVFTVNNYKWKWLTFVGDGCKVLQFAILSVHLGLLHFQLSRSLFFRLLNHCDCDHNPQRSMKSLRQANYLNSAQLKLFYRQPYRRRQHGHSHRRHWSSYTCTRYCQSGQRAVTHLQCTQIRHVLSRWQEITQFYLSPPCLSTSGISHRPLLQVAENHHTSGQYWFPVPLREGGWVDLDGIQMSYAHQRWSPIPVLTGLGVVQLHWYAHWRYHYAEPKPWSIKFTNLPTGKWYTV